MSERTEPAERTQNRVWRLTFDYVGDQITLVGQEQVAMLAPPDDSEHVERGQAGYHVELRDEAGTPIYRRVIHAPLADSYEVFSPEPGAPIRRLPMRHPHGRFEAIVPDVEGGRTVALVGPPARPARPGRAEGAAARTGGPTRPGQTTLIEVRLGQQPEARS